LYVFPAQDVKSSEDIAPGKHTRKAGVVDGLHASELHE